MKECPNCKTIHETNTRYCECGYDLRLNTIDDTKIKYPVSSKKFLIIILINLFSSVVGISLTPIILIGLFGFLVSPSTGSKVITSLIIVIFLTALVISNYLIIRKVPGKGKIYLALTGLTAFLLGFMLLFNAYFK
ncbi:hypothetical protein [Ruminiclostridium papyrosolvens]|uniref:Uncharacterized protein n=1 Tax=Ruminiclostridium papyrosolvens C7 TaxID=1330534 RepID=U4R235_9FIRM|nr:hypothetical protein [Ruminiclostridium papyrosolvens]EPR12327.1 hypothetical protein L323_08245 [Ruminiclostridium papyrosolvens C7]